MAQGQPAGDTSKNLGPLFRRIGPPLATHAADITRLSPVSWRHINFLGRYEFLLPENVANGALRPLREPNSEWDF